MKEGIKGANNTMKKDILKMFLRDYKVLNEFVSHLKKNPNIEGIKKLVKDNEMEDYINITINWAMLKKEQMQEWNRINDRWQERLKLMDNIVEKSC